MKNNTEIALSDFIKATRKTEKNIITRHSVKNIGKNITQKFLLGSLSE